MNGDGAKKPEQVTDGRALITIEAVIVNGQVQDETVRVTQNMGQWLHAGIVLVHAMKVAMTQMASSQDKTEKKGKLWIPVGPGDMRA